LEYIVSEEVRKLSTTIEYAKIFKEEEMSRIRAELIVASLEKNESLIDHNQLRVLLDQSQLFLTNVEPLYRGFSTAHKQRFLALAFPEGLQISDGKCRTPEKSYIFTRLEEIKSKKRRILNW
jgi:hypothetical protein